MAEKRKAFDFYRTRQQCIAVLGVVILVRPSVTRVLCNEMKEHTADILIPYDRAIILVFSIQQRLACDAHFHLKFTDRFPVETSQR